jgi:hypothetical protein
MIQAVFVTNQGIGDSTQIEESIPIGVVSGYSGNFDGEDQPDMAQGNLSGHGGKAASVGCARA